MTEDDRRVVLERFEFDRTLAAFDGTAQVGVTMCFSFQLSVPGSEVLPAAGVTFVAVLPTHRRRGVLNSLMRRQLADIRDRGEPLAILWASESVIYPRYGYGRASWCLNFTLKRGEGTLTRAAAAAAARNAAASGSGWPTRRPSCPSWPRSTTRCCRPGPGSSRAATRGGGGWSTTRRANGGASPLRCLLAEDDHGPRGYALYSANDPWNDFLPENVLNVRELMAADPAASGALWTDLLGRDLTTEFRLPRRPVDDPLAYQLADPRRTRSTLVDSLWVRLTDVPRALAGRRYASPVERGHRGAGRDPAGQRGPVAADHRGRRRGPRPGGVVRPAAGAADLALDVTELGAAYLGGTRLAALAEAGLVTELRPGAVRALTAALAWDPAPWCPLVF